MFFLLLHVKGLEEFYVFVISEELIAHLACGYSISFPEQGSQLGLHFFRVINLRVINTSRFFCLVLRDVDVVLVLNCKVRADKF